MGIFGTIKQFLQHFRKEQRGTTALIFSIMVIPLIAIAGGAVDYGAAVKTKSQMASTLDAAVLAALKEYSLDSTVDYKKVVNDFVHENLSDTEHAYLGGELNIVVDDIAENGELFATISTNVATNFLGLVGFDEFNLSVKSSAIGGGVDLEVALVLDNTGSMSGDKIVALRDSAKDLVNILLADGNEDRVSIALVPFAEYVNIGMDMRTETGLNIPADYIHPDTEVEYKWYGCMGSRVDGLNVTDDSYGTLVPGIMMFHDPVVNYTKTSTPHQSWRCPAAPVIDLTNSKSDIISGIDDMTAAGWTYIPGGLSWGWRVLSDQAPFTSGVANVPGEVRKVIVLMTDGENTRGPELWTNDTTVNHSAPVYGHSIHSTEGAAAAANPITETLCDNIKADNIVVFTIAFEVEDGSPVEKLMRDCAGNGGQFFDADSAEELESAFNQIGLSLLNLRLSQ